MSVGDLYVVQQSVSIFYNLFFKSELEEDDDDYIEILFNKLKLRLSKIRGQPIRVVLFMENTVSNFSQQEFQSHFRISRAAFDWLLKQIIDDLRSPVGRHVIDPQKQLLSVIWLLSTPDSYRSVGLMFGMGKSSLSHCFARVIRAICKLAPVIISWPTQQRRRQIAAAFARLAGLEGVIGAIDGTYVPIKAPYENPEVYVNRKCFHGITLQAICDHERKFLDCFTGYPSSVSDIRIFRNSDIHQEIVRNQQEYFNKGQHILGDKGYTNEAWCVTPYIDRGRLENVQRNFNFRHAQTRQTIERAFALLFGRFRRLRYLDMNRLDMIPYTILACCVLHNVCLEHVDNLTQMFEAEGAEFVQGDDDQVGDHNENDPLAIRDNMAHQLFMQQQ